MSPEEIGHLRNLRQAASTEAAFLNAQLSMLGSSFNYAADLKLARCELDAINCLIGLIDLRFAVYKGDKTLGDAVVRSEHRASGEESGETTGFVSPKRPFSGFSPLDALDKPLDGEAELQAREDACFDVWEKTHDWQRVLESDPFLVESARFRHAVAKRCGRNDDGSPRPPKKNDVESNIDFYLDDSEEANALRRKSAKLLSGDDDGLADEIDRFIDIERKSTRPRPVLGMELQSGIVMEFPSVSEAVRSAYAGRESNLKGDVSAVIRCADRMPYELFEAGADAVLGSPDCKRLTHIGWAFRYSTGSSSDTSVAGREPKKRSTVARPVLAMSMEDGKVVEFKSITEAAKAVSPDTSVQSMHVQKRASRMNPELWARGPRAIMDKDVRNFYTFKGWAFAFKSDIESASATSPQNPIYEPQPEVEVTQPDSESESVDEDEQSSNSEGMEIVGLDLSTGQERRFKNAVVAVRVLFRETDPQRARNLSMSVRAIARRMSVHDWISGPGYFLHDAPDNMRYRGWTFIFASELDEFRKEVD